MDGGDSSKKSASDEKVGNAKRNVDLKKEDEMFTHEDVEKDYDFGSASSRRESDEDSWETVSEEMRAEVQAHQTDGRCLCHICEMKSLSVSTRLIKRNKFSKDNLPENVSSIISKNGTHIYIIGTAHFSKASQDDVAKTIEMLSPDVVMVELCQSRIGVLKLDEEALLKAAQDVSITKLKVAIKESGSVVSGVMQLLLLSMSAHITKQLGMAPGGEFRVATREAKRIPGCRLVLGDRPIQATLGRAMASLSIYQKLKLGWHLLFSKDNITKEDVEKYKQKDMIAEMMAEMTGDFPELSRVFVEERDAFMANMLCDCGEMVRKNLPASICMQQVNSSENDRTESEEDEVVDQLERMTELNREDYGPVVVGVVGIGHMIGILQNIDKPCNVDDLMHVPPASLTSRAIKFTVKAAVVAAISWGVYSVVSFLKS